VPGEFRPSPAWTADVAALAGLLHETADHHGAFEEVAPPRDWRDWYAIYLDARQHGSTPDVASAAAGRHLAEVTHIVVWPGCAVPGRGGAVTRNRRRQRWGQAATMT
jgi:hypothetical protein